MSAARQLDWVAYTDVAADDHDRRHGYLRPSDGHRNHTDKYVTPSAITTASAARAPACSGERRTWRARAADLVGDLFSVAGVRHADIGAALDVPRQRVTEWCNPTHPASPGF